MGVNKLDQVSVTEVASFRECRRRWLWEQVHGYMPKTPSDYLWFGDLIHAALQEYGVTKDVRATLAIFEKKWQDSIPDLQKGYGMLWASAEPLILEMRELGRAMLTNYSRFESQMQKTQPLQTVAVEQRVWVPIRTPDGKRILKGAPRLTARMDRIVAVKNDLYLQDYKTGTGDWNSGRSLEMNDQVTGYNFVYWRMTAELFAGVFLETLLKKVPNKPKILKNGNLSTDKDQNTLYELYRQAMQDMGLMGSAKHRECLEALRSEGWDGYFKREFTQRNIQQILAYEEHLFYTYRDMREVVKNPAKAYPNFNPMHCSHCPFRNPCLAKEEGSDFEHILNTQFTVRTEKRW